MPTPPEGEQPPDGPVLEPIRVLRLRRTDALAELFREFEQDTRRYESVPLPRPASGSDDDTQELPTVTNATTAHGPAIRGDGPFGRGRGLRRTAVVVSVAAAALVGFGGALLLAARNDDSAAQAPTPTPTPTASAPQASAGAADPDGAGTLREGDSGPEVSELQERLLQVPNVYQDGPTSGAYDTVLTEAVARFQLWYGVRGDENGVYGNDTRIALESRTAAQGNS